MKSLKTEVQARRKVTKKIVDMGDYYFDEVGLQHMVFHGKITSKDIDFFDLHEISPTNITI